MKPALYVETSVVSYLTARPSRDIVAAARQQLTEQWWQRRDEYDLFASPLVLEEAGMGDAEAAAARLHILREIQLVAPAPEADALAERLFREVPFPTRAAADAVHIAVAATAGARFLLTWNFKHIANPVLRERIGQVCRLSGVEPPILCTPEDLLEATSP